MIPIADTSNFWRQIRLVLRDPITEAIVMDGIYPDINEIITDSTKLLNLIPKPYRVTVNMLRQWPLIHNRNTFYRHRNHFNARCCIFLGYLNQVVSFLPPDEADLGRIITRRTKPSLLLIKDVLPDEACDRRTHKAQLKSLIYKICAGDKAVYDDDDNLIYDPEDAGDYSTKDLYRQFHQLSWSMGYDNPDDLWQVFQQYNFLIRNDANLVAIFRKQGVRWVCGRVEQPVEFSEVEKTPEEREKLSKLIVGNLVNDIVNQIKRNGQR